MNEDTVPYCKALYEHAMTHGRDAKTGFLMDEISSDGQPRRSSHRLWPQTELIKAQVARYAQGDQMAALAAAQTMNALMDHYIDQAQQAGAWVDQLDAGGEILNASAPASTFYHLVTAISEMDRVLQPFQERTP